MKRILVVTPRYPFPVIGGDRLRIVEIGRTLARDFSIDLLALTSDPHEVGAIPPPHDNPFNEIAQVYLPKWRSMLNCLLALPSRHPLQLAYFWSAAMAKEVARRAPTYDALLFHLARAAQYRPVNSHMPAMVELTDAISLNYQRIRTTKGIHGIRAAVFGFDQPRIAHYERNLLTTFDASVLVSPVDRDYLTHGEPGLRQTVLVCPNGIDLAHYPFQGHDSNSKTLAFVGNLESLQNLDAVFWFAREVLPLLRAQDAGYQFKIIGRIRSGDATRLTRIPGVEVIGEVDAISTHLKGCLCGVCPVRIGAGIQNKILEYMASGLPAIVSTVGLEGLQAQPEKDLLVADEVQDYVRAILSLRSIDRLGEDLSASGRRYVEQHHNWTQNLRPMVDRLKALTD